MRLSRAFLPTLKEVPAEAQVASHIFLIRGGYMRKIAAGVYTYLPLGLRVLQNVERIIREEMNRAGAHEVLMPAAIPAELWQESGRWEQYGPELLRFKDRKGADFCVGPTHEEVIVDMVRRDVKSYRSLPLNLYQVQTKFRDEMRPRAGLLRGREFIMKDAYSFHTDQEDVLRTYEAMRVAYRRIFTRCGLDFREVEADTGAIGGSSSHEFQVLAQTGEDKIVSCPKCNYTANVEQAEVARAAAPAASGATPAAVQKIHTPGKGGITDVAAFLKRDPKGFIKTLVYIADGKPVVALVRGDHDLNEIKLKKAVGALEVALASEATVKEVTRAPVGYAGPMGLDVPVYGDLDLQFITDGVTGANEGDHHVTGVDAARDLKHVKWADLRLAGHGDRCPRCNDGVFDLFQGIEVGHVFVLGTKYSKAMGCTYLAEDGQARDMVMGCYGIGVTRVAASAIEQSHDKDGIIWPMSIAPYQVHLMTLGNDEPVVAEAERLYKELNERGVSVLFDDRDERPGGKFKDADLIGVPLRLAVGKKSLAEGKVELKHRREAKAELVEAASAVETVITRVAAELAAIAVKLKG